jgi:Fic-DOC domain mobile mystery protein B
MSSEIFGQEPVGATPLTEDDYIGLKPKWIANRDDLNLAEAQNISEAFDKYFRGRLQLDVILDDLFVRKLHTDMYSKVWAWAGTYRQVETSIGVAPARISHDVKVLMEDAKYWLASDIPSEIDEAACQVHHRLVQIHPFRNGNGRMTRVFADLLLNSLGQTTFTWGGGDLETVSPTRTAYIRALRAADIGDMTLLLQFVRAPHSSI